MVLHCANQAPLMNVRTWMHERMPDMETTECGRKKHTGSHHGPLSKEKNKCRSEMRANYGGCWVITEKNKCKIYSVLEYHSKES